MESNDWWIFGTVLGSFLIIQIMLLFGYIRQTQSVMDSISRLRHTLADVSATNAEVERAYKMLMLHNGRVLEERWGTRPD